VSGTNKRVFNGCLGIGTCTGSPLPDILSVDYSLSRSINNIYQPQNSNPIATYGLNPDIEIRYTSYMVNGFPPLASEEGLNSIVGFKLLVGLDDPNTWPDIKTTNVPLDHKAIGGSLMLLNSITYSLSVDGPGTIQRSYRGYSKPAVDAGASVPFKVPSPTSTTYLTLRNKFTGTIPAEIALNALQSITITRTFNRQLVNEFATRKPYASHISFPVETSCTFDLLSQDLDTYEISAMDTACKNPKTYKTDINISLCEGSPISIPKSYLTGLQYSGATADSSDNQTISATYTSYETPVGLEPVYIFPDEDPCEQ
jgi:hypothetical protein